MTTTTATDSSTDSSTDFSVARYRRSLYVGSSAINDKAEYLDVVFRAAQAVSSLSLACTSSHALDKFHTFFGTGRAAVGVVRTLLTLAEVSGGSLEDSLKKQAYMKLTLQVALCGGRVLNGLLIVNKSAPLLGSHARGMGIGTGCFFATVNGLDFVMCAKALYDFDAVTYKGEMGGDAQAAVDAINEQEKLRVNFLTAALELACTPFECGFVQITSLWGAIVAALLNLATCALKLFSYYKYSYLLDETVHS